jgi:basic membrane protein A
MIISPKLKIPFFIAFILLTALLITGCSKPKETTSQSVPPKTKISAAVVTDVGGIGDLSFNAMAWDGLQRAGKDLGVKVNYVESKEQADYSTNMEKLAQQGYNVVFAVGFLMEDAVAKAAAEYPKTRFIIIDGNAPKLPNAQAIKFREEEGCFLAGALAGLVSKSGTIGFVGGMDVPLIKRFEVSYTAGARTVKPAVKVLAAYTGRFDDPGKGKELALTQFSQGADIIFHASGSCGLGVIDAAKSKGKGYYAIGVDADQDHIAAGSVLTSMMKRVDNAVYSACKSVVNGSFKSGDRIFGIKDGGISLSPMKYTHQDISPAAMSKVKQLEGMILQGKLHPPKTPEELKSFTPPL